MNKKPATEIMRLRKIKILITVDEEYHRETFRWHLVVLGREVIPLAQYLIGNLSRATNHNPVADH
jgi:hypothetical protein